MVRMMLTIHIEANADDTGDHVICLDVHANDAASFEATGACSADDQAALADAKTVGEKQDKCGKSALGLSGIDHDKSHLASRVTLASARLAPSATTLLPTTGSRTARQHAFLAGASL